MVGRLATVSLVHDNMVFAARLPVERLYHLRLGATGYREGLVAPGANFAEVTFMGDGTHSKPRGWFRVYDRMPQSPDVVPLSDRSFRLLITCWSIASSQDSSIGHVPFADVQLQMRCMIACDADEFRLALKELTDAGLLVKVDGGYTAKDWSRHQFSEAQQRRESSVVAEYQRVCKATRQSEIKTLKAMPYDTFLTTIYWCAIRNYVLWLHDYMCSECESTKNLNVHHRTYDHRGEDHNHLDDLVALCKDCHAKEHGISEGN